MSRVNEPRLMIDCDTGVDDARAIMMALTSPVNVLAISCVSGNCSLEQALTNTSKVLQLCQRTDIPLYGGARAPLSGRVQDAHYFHGLDGLGDMCTPVEAGASINNIPCLQDKHAALAMIDIVNKYPGEVTLVTLAPLTNVALAVRLDPEFGKKLRKLIIMGSNIRGEGNHIQAPGAEFNFAVDPEAASITLNEMGCKITIVPWETCSRSGLPWDWFESLVNGPSALAKFSKEISTYDFERRDNKEKTFVACDAVAMMVYLQPEAILGSMRQYCCVELRGEFTRGQMVVDTLKLIGRDPNVEIITDIDTKLLMEKYENMLV